MVNERKMKSHLEADKKYIWHPFTQTNDYNDSELPVITKGKKQFLFDDKGNRYYDTIASWWTSTIGHCNPKINKRIIRQLSLLDHVHFSGFTHPYAVELAEELVKVLPSGLRRIFFSDNGSTAVESALKIAYQYYINLGINDKKYFVRFTNSYHGDTLGAVSVGGIEYIHSKFSHLLFQTFSVNSPICSKCLNRKSEYTLDASNTGCSLECFDEIEKLLTENHLKIAGLIIEPILQAAGNMNIYPAKYLHKLRELTEKLNIILIFDEVATGFGRLGSFFAMDKAEVIPDIITLSKGLTGGYLPLALTICKEHIYEAFCGEYNEGKTFLHGHSYTANPICCAAASANIKEMIRLKLPQSKSGTISYFHERIKEFSQYDFINDIRYSGFTGAVDIVKSKKNKISFAPDKRTGFRIYKKSLLNGIILRPLDDTIYWFLPFSMNKKDIKIIMDKSLKSIVEAVNE